MCKSAGCLFKEIRKNLHFGYMGTVGKNIIGLFALHEVLEEKDFSTFAKRNVISYLRMIGFDVVKRSIEKHLEEYDFIGTLKNELSVLGVMKRVKLELCLQVLLEMCKSCWRTDVRKIAEVILRFDTMLMNNEHAKKVGEGYFNVLEVERQIFKKILSGKSVVHDTIL